VDLPAIEAALADLQDCLGKVDDAELARLAGLLEEDVAALRDARGIRAWTARGRRARAPDTRLATPAELEDWHASQPAGASCYRIVFEDAVVFVAAGTVGEAIGAASAACRSTPVGVEPVGRVV
jgi:hypothetical protein